MRPGDDAVARIAEIAEAVCFRVLREALGCSAALLQAQLAAGLQELAARQAAPGAKGTAGHRQRRNAAICAAHAAGVPPAELAQRFHLGPEQIRRILRRTSDERREPD